MKTKYYILMGILLLIGLPFFIRGCYLPISGTVIDAETSKPIDGAVVLVEWDKTTGIGLVNTKFVKKDETITDKNGHFSLPGIFELFVNPPTMVIYKPHYVAWRNDRIFPDWKKREDFKWKSGKVYRMEQFKKGYLYTKHSSFIGSGVHFDSSYKLWQLSRWEDQLEQKELNLFHENLGALEQKEKTEDQIWDEIKKTLYFSTKEKDYE